MCELDGNHETSLPAFLSAYGDFTLPQWLLPISDAPGAAAPSTATPSSGRGCRRLPSGEEQRRHRRLPLPTGAPHRRHRRYTFTSPRHLAQSGDAPSTFNHTAAAPEVVHTKLLMSCWLLQPTNTSSWPATRRRPS